MRRWLLLASALVIGTGGVAGSLGSTAWAGSPASPASLKPAAGPAAPHQVAGRETFTSGAKQIIRLDPTTVGPQARAQARMAAPLITQAPTAKINVTYIGFSAPARAAFQAAVNIWQTQIHSTVPIDVVADWSNLTQQYGDGSILGAAGPTTFVSNFPNAPLQNVWYPAALANAIAGSDQLPPNVCSSNPYTDFPDASGSEISASFNSASTIDGIHSAWYLGTDGNPGPNQVDLESVVLHELGHGLGFVGSFDGLDPSTGQDTGKGYYGLSGNGTDPTIFDNFVADGLGHPLESTYTNGTSGLGNALRGGDSGLQWDGSAGDAAASGAPVLFSPNPFQEGSSFSHLDENDYPAGNANALMTPMLHPGEVEQSVGPIVLGMFQDMGWPQSGSPAATSVGDYHVAAPKRLVSAHVVSSSAPLHVLVAGQDGLPSSGIKSVVVNVTVEHPSRIGVWSALANCVGTGNVPDSQNYQSGQPRTAEAVLPVDDNGNIEVALTASPVAAMSGTVSVDLIGWYGAGGVSYHQLGAAKQVFGGAVSPTPAEVKVTGVGNVPATGVTAVVVQAGEGFGNTPGFLFVGPGGVNSTVPIVGYTYAELTQGLAIIPVGTGASAGMIRVRLNTGHAQAVLNVIGWYGPSTVGGGNFHSAGPARLTPAPHGQDVTIGGLPPNTAVLLNVHLSKPTNTGTLTVGPGGSSALVAVQEVKAGQPTSGSTVVMTSPTGTVRLHLSAGTATFYTDFDGWYAP